jgi:hypothetical protein
MMTLFRAFLLAVFIAAPLTMTAGCETTAQSVQKQETNLAALGFVPRPADTPVRVAMLAKLPPHKFLRRTHGSAVNYVYADPLDCHCLYVGSAKAYAQYHQLQQLRVAVKEIRNDAFAEDMAGSDYADSGWDWGAWGGFGPDFESGPGFGW